MQALLLTVALCVAVPIPEKGPAPAPTGPAPTMVVLSRVDAETGMAEHVQTTVRYVAENRTRAVNIGGVIRNVTETVMVPVLEQRAIALNLKESKRFSPDGKELTLAETLKRLKVGAAVVLSHDGRMIHPTFAQLLRDDAVILAPSPIPVAPAPVPVPPVGLPPPPLPPAPPRF